MKTLQIYRLTPVLFLTLTVLFTACDSLTGTNPDAPAPALETSAALRIAQIQDEPTIREIPTPPVFATPDESLDQTSFSFKAGHGAPDQPDKQVDFGASVVTENAHSIIVRFGARR